MTGVTKLAGMSKEEGVGGGGEKEEVKGSLIMAGQRSANKAKYSFSANALAEKLYFFLAMDADRLR